MAINLEEQGTIETSLVLCSVFSLGFKPPTIYYQVWSRGQYMGAKRKPRLFRANWSLREGETRKNKQEGGWQEKTPRRRWKEQNKKGWWWETSGIRQRTRSRENYWSYRLVWRANVSYQGASFYTLYALGNMIRPKIFSCNDFIFSGRGVTRLT